MPPDSAAIRGRQEIQRFWQGVQGGAPEARVLHTEHVLAEGDLAAEVATAELFGEAEGGQGVTVPVKYVVVWRREAGGEWRMAVDIWNSRPAD